MAWRVFKVAANVALALLVVELLSFLMLRTLSIRDQGRLTGEERNPAYAGKPWAPTYWLEHRQFLSQSYENYPYGLWRLRPFSGETINVGKDGLRRTANVDCEGSAPVIEIYGSSLVWGQGSPDWETIPSLVAKKFADDGKRVCVVNRGTDAWRSSESVIQLIEQLRSPAGKLPSAVVFIDSCNDVFTPFTVTGRVDEPYNFKKGWLDALSQIHRGGFYYLTASNTWTLAERLLRRGASARLPAIQDRDLLARQIAETYLNNLKIVSGLASAYGFRFEFFWMPLNMEGQDAVYRDAAERTVRLIGDRSGDHLHDLTGVIPSALSLGGCHLVPEGNAIVADRVYQSIK